MSFGNSFNIPHYLRASTPEALRLKMLENNLKSKLEYRYFDISFDGKNWIVWFYKEATEGKLPDKKDN